MNAPFEHLVELQQTETAILRTFAEVCDKLNLRYFLLAGTLLGAARHQGFIPWDDDIDVGMPRADYEIFLEKGQQYLPEHLFIQSFISDPEYPLSFAKLRNSNTTFIESAISHLKINHGVYIDIFPIDYYPDDKREQLRFNAKNAQYRRRLHAIWKKAAPEPWKTRLKTAPHVLRYPSAKRVIHLREKLYRSVPKSSLMISYAGIFSNKEVMPAAWFADVTTLPFEGMTLSVPAKYHEWLTHMYGDYMQLPPEEKRIAHHYADVIDLHKPYTEYV